MFSDLFIMHPKYSYLCGSTPLKFDDNNVFLIFHDIIVFIFKQKIKILNLLRLGILNHRKLLSTFYFSRKSQNLFSFQDIYFWQYRQIQSFLKYIKHIKNRILYTTHKQMPVYSSIKSANC